MGERERRKKKGKRNGERKKKDAQISLDVPASFHDSKPYLFPYLYASPSEMRTNSSIFLKQ